MDKNVLQHTKLHGVTDYIDAIDTVVGLAHNIIRVFDNSLESTGFNSLKRYEMLRSFLLASRKNRLQIVVHDPAYLEKRCPRMIMLIKQFSHSFSIHRTQSHARHVTDPFIIADDRHYVRRYHFDDLRGLMALHDPKEAEALNLHFDEIWAASNPAISATTTGL